jgi:hypothetical protein
VVGSGKSSLVHGSIPVGAGVVSVDQAPVRGSRRSLHQTAQPDPRRLRAPPGGDGARRLDIDLGPGAGHDGGRIVFAGTPADLVATRSTLTGAHLAAYVGT